MMKYRDLIVRLIPICLAVVVTIALSEIFYRNMLDTAEENCWKELSMARSEVGREVGARLTSNIKMLELAADALILNAGVEDEGTLRAYLAMVREETIFDRIDLVLPTGRIFVSSAGEWVDDPGEKPYQELVARGAHLSQRVTDFYTGQKAIHAFAPVYDAQNEPVAIIGATVYCTTLADLFTSAHYGEDAQVFLVDRRDGDLVLDAWHETPGTLQYLANRVVTGEATGADYAQDVLDGGTGQLSFTSATNSKPTYLSYAAVEDTHYSVALAIQAETAFADLIALRETLVRVAAVETALVLFYTLWVYLIMRESLRNEQRARQAEMELLHQREQKLESRYNAAASRQDFLETLAVNLPGGYHRCTSTYPFRVTFASKSFTEATGYTLEQLNAEHGGSYMGIVAPEDQDYFISLTPQLVQDGHMHCAYRIRRRDGSIRWVQDSTQYVERDGEKYYQCSLSDIHDIILRQEELARQASMLDSVETNMPGGYHRCTDAEGWPFLYISKSFEEITGWDRAEIEAEFGNRFINMVLPEDIPLCAGIIEELQRKGVSTAMYRLKKKGGGYIWASDSTMRVRTEEGTFFQGVLADVTDQVEEMERAKHEAEASSQAKSTFLFNISHDIRTPMNAIKGFSRIIGENAEDPCIVRRTVSKINQAGDSLMMLMDDVLDISRIERGKEEVNLQPLDLYEHGRNLFEMFAPDMQAAGLHFMADGEEIRDHVYCDELKLTRIMMNMLSNARKFTPAGGTVRFGCTRLERDGQACTYRFFVRDTGIGMSPEFQKRAFEQFERERTSTESGVTGSGLGLAIIKMLTELMGGTVDLRSELGKGTEVSATLTFRLADPESTRSAVTPDESLPDMNGKRVLLVEDNDFNREIARYLLEGMHFTVEEAAHGGECIEKLLSAGAGYYDLILMDIQMPVMDGYTAAIEIRNLPDRQLAAVPIVAMTANAFEEDRKKCLDVGMNGHVGKPIDMAALTQVLARVFQ